MWWYQQVSETEKQKVHVPFYFSTTGDERFLMDMFMNTVSSGGTDDKHAEAIYNQLPRAIMQLDSLNIDAGSLTNKFVRAFYQRQEKDGTLMTYNSIGLSFAKSSGKEATAGILVPSTSI